MTDDKLIEEIKYVRGLLVRAVEEKGADYVYPRLEPVRPSDSTCHYVRDDAPSCIVGHVFAYHGVSVDVLAANEGRGAWSLVSGLGLSTSGPIREALSKAQAAQDGGKTWGEALKAFDYHVAKCGFPVS